MKVFCYNFLTCLALACYLPYSALGNSLSLDSDHLKIRLGVTVPLTGSFASYGNLIRDGVEFARSDLRELGYQVEVFYEDACLPNPSISALRSLVSIKKINALVANFCVIAIPPMAPLVNKHQLLTFHTASASDSVLEASPIVFSTNSRVKDEARVLVEHAFSKGARTASIFFVATDFGEDYNKYFKLYFEKLGGKVLSSDLGAIGQTDFRTEVIRAKAKKPDLIFAAHLGLSLGSLVKQIRNQGIKVPILSVYEAEDPSVLKEAKDLAEGLEFFTPEITYKTPASDRFNRRFQKTFGYQPRILAKNAYDATVLAAKALRRCRLDATCAKDWIYTIKNYPGVSGVFSIDSDGGASRSFVLKKVIGGQFRTVSESPFRFVLTESSN